MRQQDLESAIERGITMMLVPEEEMPELAANTLAYIRTNGKSLSGMDENFIESTLQEIDANIDILELYDGTERSIEILLGVREQIIALLASPNN